MPLASIVLQFDPIVRIADRPVRLETVGLGLVILSVLVLATAIARSVAEDQDDPGLFVHGPRLRSDDLLFIVLGIVPGAVLGGRLAYGLIHLDFYAADPGALLDPGQGSLHLTGALIGGTLSGTAIARLLDGTVGRWLHVAALPTILGLALGKVVMAFGGTGQGLPANLDWATAYDGPGPWGSLSPATPSHPAQLYEAVAGLIVVAVLLAMLGGGAFRRRDGRLFLIAIALWGIGRLLVAAAWRDAEVVGPLRTDQLLSIALVGLSIGGFIALRRLGGASRAGDPEWPAPDSRPRF